MIFTLAVAAAASVMPVTATAAPWDLEARAVRAAVDRVSPSVVEIRTVGGGRRVAGQLVDFGPTTGLIISADGYVVSSLFGFAQRPASILVRLPDGRHVAARLVATDHSRKIVLLKVTAANQQLPVPVAAPAKEIDVGAWAIAVGRTFAGEQPNLSVGIVSAVNRLFGKAIQTDARISPNHYGGPLIDIRGRVMGIVVPMSPRDDSDLAGLEWYDSGVGFAVPLMDINRVVPRLKQGTDLYPGILGVSLRRGNPYVSPAEVAAVQPNSPGRAAGLKPGDRIVRVDGRTIGSQMEFRAEIARRYAGDRVHLALLRDQRKVEADAVLTDRLVPFQHAFLGVLPERPPAATPHHGVEVRYVYPGSPAQRAGLKVGDVIVALAEKPVTTVGQALDILNTHSPGDSIAVRLDRAGKRVSVRVATGRLPTAVPAELPRRKPRKMGSGPRPPTGRTQLTTAGRKAACPLYVPKDYDPNVLHGVLVLLSTPNDTPSKTSIHQWESLCDTDGLILLAPGPVLPAGWSRADVDQIRKLLRQVMDTYRVDPTRIVVCGSQTAGVMATVVALTARRLIRGLAVVDVPVLPKRRLPANDPVARLAVYVVRAAAKNNERFDQGVQAFQAAGYPVTVVELGPARHTLNKSDLATLARWIDTLDRL